MSKLVDALKTASGFVCMKGATTEHVTQAEETLGVAFADDYKEYVLECGAASFKGHELTGVCLSKRLNVIDVTAAARKANPTIPNDMYVIEEANIDGILIWQNASGAIYITKPCAGIRQIATSIREYLKL